MNVRFSHEGSLEMKIRPTLTGIVVCLTVAACSSFQAYDGPPRPDNETALIKTTTITSRFVQGGTPPRSFLISVDALELQDLGEIRVLPGGRCVTLRIIYTPFSGDATIRQNSLLCFDALAGRTYEVRANIDDFSATAQVRTWLVDLESGETVADGQLQAS